MQQNNKKESTSYKFMDKSRIKAVSFRKEDTEKAVFLAQKIFGNSNVSNLLKYLIKKEYDQNNTPSELPQ